MHQHLALPHAEIFYRKKGLLGLIEDFAMFEKIAAKLADKASAPVNAELDRLVQLFKEKLSTHIDELWAEMKPEITAAFRNVLHAD